MVKQSINKKLVDFYRRGGKPDYSDRIKPSSDGSGWSIETDRDRRLGPQGEDNYRREGE